ncbi:ABC transporter permease [Afipia sp. GAS231]|uniref:ABC transporter permease n=1 Tax=Afipia sp. GAS231 TaxID=1882747 RepID=UPI00087932E7|nr:ABC transporter permease subunit [Afipia sp. GAS231]SDO54527.1 NitT/TauT family transport system permease protein/putative hydroxymethylpyrimidine transport system permease protein [Afipia sp. GAS231]
MSITTASLARTSAPFAIQAAFVAAILVLWHLSISREWVDTIFLASPLDTALAFIPTTISAEPHLAATFSSFAPSLITGVLAALIVGLLVNTSEYAYKVFMPLLVLGVIIPKVTLLPLFVLWFGIDKATVIVYGALSAFFPMVVNVSAASREVKPAHITLARAMGYSKSQIYLKIILPAMLPVLTSGLFYACNAALMGVFIVELALARFGIGAFVRTLAITFRTPELYAAIILTSLITVIINMLLWSLSRRFSQWRT